jgi:hypothetical protein
MDRADVELHGTGSMSPYGKRLPMWRRHEDHGRQRRIVVCVLTAGEIA